MRMAHIAGSQRRSRLVTSPFRWSVVWLLLRWQSSVAPEPRSGGSLRELARAALSEHRKPAPCRVSVEAPRPRARWPTRMRSCLLSGRDWTPGVGADPGVVVKSAGDARARSALALASHRDRRLLGRWAPQKFRWAVSPNACPAPGLSTLHPSMRMRGRSQYQPYAGWRCAGFGGLSGPVRGQQPTRVRLVLMEFECPLLLLVSF
jgi:hypothetical protein